MSQDKTLEEELKELVVETQIQPKELVSMALKTLEEHLDEFLIKLYANEVQELLEEIRDKNQLTGENDSDESKLPDWINPSPLKAIQARLELMQETQNKPSLEMTDDLLYVPDVCSYTTTYFDDIKGYFTEIERTPEERIRTLKKQIKHCKNHMERKLLEQQLNEAYRERRENGRKKIRTDSTS